MSKKLLRIITGQGVLWLGIMLVTIIYTQSPVAGQGPPGGIGALGLGDPLNPALGLSEVYWFTGVHNEEVGNTKFATVVHCTNASLVDVEEVYVQFFKPSPSDANDYTYVSAAIPANDTVTFSTQPIGSFTNEHSPPLTITDIQHGSGRVLSTNETGSRLICTIQALTLDGNNGDLPADVARLHLYDDQGNLITSTNPSGAPGAGGGIFLPLIFKN